MSSTDAKLCQIRTFLGKDIDGLLENPNCKLFFESIALARKGDKNRKPCIIYIIYNSLLICRPRKYSKKYYVKFNIPVESIHIDTSETYDSSDTKSKMNNPCELSLPDHSHYSIWFPSPTVKASFISSINEACAFIHNQNTFQPQWTPFAHSISFSYHNELMQQYSYIHVSGCGTSDVNGTYYPIGILNNAFVWENEQHMYLTREVIDNTIGWIFGNLQIYYYGQPTNEDFPPTNQLWKCYSGKEPLPILDCFIAGECYSTVQLKKTLSCSQKSIQWNNSLLQAFYHSICEEFYFSEIFYNHNLKLILSVYEEELLNSFSKSSPSSSSTETSNEPPIQRKNSFTFRVSSLFKHPSEPIVETPSPETPSPETPSEPQDENTIDEIHEIFQGINDLIELSNQLIQSLHGGKSQTAEEELQSLLSLLQSHSSHFSYYEHYIDHLKQACQLLHQLKQHDTISILLSKLSQKPCLHNQSLECCLSLPIERIQYYEMIFSSLLTRIPRSSSLFTQTHDIYRFILHIHDRVRCMIHTLSINPPIDSAITVGIPLSILWSNNNHFYGSFNVTVGYNDDIEIWGNQEGIIGQLFIYDTCCYFGIPNILMRNGQFTILFQFQLKSIHIHKSKNTLSQSLLFQEPKQSTFCIVFDSLSDKQACEMLLAALQRSFVQTNETTINITNQSFESIDEELEKLLDPSSSSFALLGDELAMSRLSIYREFLSTEYNYIRDLQTMSDVFEEPLLNDLKKKEWYLNENEIHTVFGNYRDLLNIHLSFYQSIKQNIRNVRLSQLISKEFLKASNQFYQYFNYCNDYSKSLQFLQTVTVERPGFATYLELLMKDPRSHGLDLYSYLIKPIQRICKYPLFLNRIISKMESNHPFRQSMLDLNEKIVSTVKRINEKMTEVSVYNSLVELCKRIEPYPSQLIQFGRKVLNEVNCKVEVNGKVKKEMMLILMNDVIVIVQNVKGLFASKDTLSLYKILMIADVTIKVLNESSLSVYDNLNQQDYTCIFSMNSFQLIYNDLQTLHVLYDCLFE